MASPTQTDSFTFHSLPRRKLLVLVQHLKPLKKPSADDTAAEPVPDGLHLLQQTVLS